MVSSVPGLTSSYWMGAIQDLLGNEGASATFDLSGSQRSVRLNGILANSSLTTPSATPSVVISFSPEAQRAMSNGQIALDLMTSSQHMSGSPSDETASASTAPAESVLASVAKSNPAGAQNSSQPPPLTPSSPAPTSLAGILAAAQSTLSDPASAFYQAFDGNVAAGAAFNGPGALAFTMPADEGAAFVDAFNNRTLAIQNAVDVPFIGYQDSSVLTGTWETAQVTYNQAAMNAHEQAAGVYSTMLIAPGIGALYVTWAKPSSTNLPSPANS